MNMYCYLAYVTHVSIYGLLLGICHPRYYIWTVTWHMSPTLLYMDFYLAYVTHVIMYGLLLGIYHPRYYIYGLLLDIYHLRYYVLLHCTCHMRYYTCNITCHMSTPLPHTGTDKQPESLSSRAVASCWWLVVIVMYAVYTGNLIAFLTVNIPNMPFDTLEGMVAQTDYKYGLEDGIIHMMLFRVNIICVLDCICM